MGGDRRDSTLRPFYFTLDGLMSNLVAKQKRTLLVRSCVRFLVK